MQEVINEATEGINEVKNIDTDVKFMAPSELIKWCKERKASLGMSNQKLAELSGVPQGTIDRILSGSYNEFRYSSIQPVLAVLLGINESTPDHVSDDEEFNQYYYETIEGYRMVLTEKNREIEMLRSRYDAAARDIVFLRMEIEKQQANLEKEQNRCEWLQTMIDEIRSSHKSHDD